MRKVGRDQIKGKFGGGYMRAKRDEKRKREEK